RRNRPSLPVFDRAGAGHGRGHARLAAADPQPALAPRQAAVAGDALPPRRRRAGPAAARILHADPAAAAGRQPARAGSLGGAGAARLSRHRHPPADGARGPGAAAHHPLGGPQRGRCRWPAGGPGRGGEAADPARHDLSPSPAVELHHDIRGAGPDLVLLHGWAMHAGVFEPLVERLSSQFTLHLVDLPGRGRSAGSGIPLRLEDTAQALAAVVPEQALWLGWSLGGLVTLHAAASGAASARGLVLLAAS